MLVALYNHRNQGRIARWFGWPNTTNKSTVVVTCSNKFFMSTSLVCTHYHQPCSTLDILQKLLQTQMNSRRWNGKIGYITYAKNASVFDTVSNADICLDAKETKTLGVPKILELPSRNLVSTRGEYIYLYDRITFKCLQVLHQ
jgi:hypothetical protein